MVQKVQGIVDTQQHICKSLGRANAGDDLVLELEIRMNGQPITFVNPMCELLIKKADNNKVRQTKDIIYQDSKFKIKVDQQGVTCPGTVINQLIINDEGKISTCLFYFTVGASLEKEILQSISKVETLEQLDSYVVAAFSNLDEYEKRLTLLDSTMKTTNEEITANESERKSNESERKTNETLRVENEKERVKKESESSAAEIDRKSSELDREKNENARRIAENTRIARENARENAEINRNAIFEENETIRNEAEKLREKAEIKRKENFNNLETLNEKLNEAEKERKEAEEDRRTKETERQLAEAERERAEANREKTYTSFNDAEVDRKNSEDARIQAEASRVQAENERSEQFEAAQSARETKFQESENTRDKLFKANETARATEEIARKQAESTREGNEAIRVNDESLRVASEKARQQEEIKRGQAEVARVEAEKVREISYEAIKKDNSTFKQQMNEDFGNAKADYFGKEHNNIVDRLNSDFDNVHQRINDANYIEYSGSNIKADNSYYGYTKELSVKGRTLQNLAAPLVFSPHGSDITVRNTNEYSVGIKPSGSTQLLKISAKLNCSLMKPNTTYTIILSKIHDSNDQFCIYDATTESFLRNYVHSNIFTFTTKSDVSHIRLYFQNNVVNETRFYNDFLILEGDYTNIDFDIPYFEGITSVGENEVTEEGKYPVKIKSCGKNLLNIKEIKSNNNVAVAHQGNKIILTSNSANTYVGVEVNLDLEQVKGKKFKIYHNGIKQTYSANGRVIQFNVLRKDGTYNYLGSSNNNSIVTIPSDSKKVTFCLYTNNTNVTNVSNTVEIDELMICYADAAQIPYQPYQESIQELQLTEPLRSLPNGVCDEILEDGTEIRRVGKVTINGSTNWAFSIHGDWSRGDNLACYTFITDRKIGSITGICDNFIITTIDKTIINHISTKECVWLEHYSRAFYFSISKTKLQGITDADVRKYLNNNPVTVYYELAEPIITKHNKSMNLKTYAGSTHITSDNYFQPKLSCKVPSNVQAVISGLKEENEALNTQVSTLNLENEEIKETNANQDELINTTMMATDEMYMMLEPLLAETLSERSASKMVDMYVAMVQRGIKTIEQVPVRYREQVKKILDQLEK